MPIDLRQLVYRLIQCPGTIFVVNTLVRANIWLPGGLQHSSKQRAPSVHVLDHIVYAGSARNALRFSSTIIPHLSRSLCWASSSRSVQSSGPTTFAIVRKIKVLESRTYKIRFNVLDARLNMGPRRSVNAATKEQMSRSDTLSAVGSCGGEDESGCIFAVFATCCSPPTSPEESNNGRQRRRCGSACLVGLLRSSFSFAFLLLTRYKQSRSSTFSTHLGTRSHFFSCS